MRSPAEYYIRFILSPEPPPYHPSPDQEEDLRMAAVKRTTTHLRGMHILYPTDYYILKLWEEMEESWPEPYDPSDPFHIASRRWLKEQRIYNLWHPNKAVKEALLIAQDIALRERLEPLLLSTMPLTDIILKLRKITAIHLTEAGLVTYKHYFWNRDLLAQDEWVSLLQQRRNTPQYAQALLNPSDLKEHLPWLVGVSGPGVFNAAEAAQRISHIAYKYAIELEHKEANVENTTALRNCITTIDRSDQILRRSEVALKDVLRQFEKFKMRQDATQVINLEDLAGSNHSGMLTEGRANEDEEADNG